MRPGQLPALVIDLHQKLVFIGMVCEEFGMQDEPQSVLAKPRSMTYSSSCCAFRSAPTVNGSAGAVAERTAIKDL